MWIADLEALSDEELVRRFVSDGVSEAVAVLLRRHQDRVFGLAYRILGNRADAPDASQEVFVGVFRKARSFRHQSVFTTWLYRLTVNACTDLARRGPRPSNSEEAMSTHADTELLSAYLDGRVPEAARARLEAHLASCPECAGRRAALEAAVGAVAALPLVSPTAEEKEAIRRGVLERVAGTGQPAGGRPGAWRRTLRWRLSAAGGAAALVVAGVFAYVVVRSSSPTPRPTTASAPAASSPAAPAFA